MKVNPKFLTLMVALAAGTAAAAGTPSGTVITNTATATFTDPTTNAAATPVNSNTVSTTVLPKPNFDIVYSAGADGTTATGTLPGNYQGQILPGGLLETPYKVVNLGNVDNYEVTLAANTTGSPSAPTSVKYYLDANNDGLLGAAERAAGAITKVTVPVDKLETGQDEGIISIIQVIEVPANAVAGGQYAASPQGTANVFDAGVITPKTEALTDLQFSRAVIYTPSIFNGVIDGDPLAAGQQPPTTSVTPPGSPASVPGYVDPTRPGTNIVAVNADNQIAYPKADVDSIADTVAFINSLTNGGTLVDTVRLFPTDRTGPGGISLATPSASGVFTLPDGVIVSFTDTNGTPLTVDPNGYPLLTVAAGQTLGYRTVVTYPDYDANPATDPSPVVILVGADSGNDGELLSDDVSTNTIYPPQLQFGDATTALGTAPTPNPVQSVVPGAASGTATADSTDGSAVFPMDLTNLGAYSDTYALTGTVDVPVIATDSTVSIQTVNVRYYSDNSGQPGTELPFVTNPNGTRTYTTGTGIANAELKVFAVVDMPTNAQATTVNGVTTNLIVKQRAEAVYSTIVREDNNDEIVVVQPNITGVALTKTEPASALPGATLSYTITAKNNYNAGLKNFYVTESNTNPNTNVFTWATFSSVSAAKTFTAGAVLYRFNGGNWQTSPTPSVTASPVTSVDVGVDTNANGSVDSNDLFPAQGGLTITFQVTVK